LLTFRSSFAPILSFTVWQYGAVRSGAAIHKRLLDSVFASTLRFLDVTPQGRIIQRFTKDVRVIDGEFTELTSTVLDMVRFPFFIYCLVSATVTLSFVGFADPSISFLRLILFLTGYHSSGQARCNRLYRPLVLARWSRRRRFRRITR
jgi:ABC-type multidrug transport system fused ATPase/permease subunit